MPATPCRAAESLSAIATRQSTAAFDRMSWISIVLLNAEHRVDSKRAACVMPQYYFSIALLNYVYSSSVHVHMSYVRCMAVMKLGFKHAIHSNPDTVKRGTSCLEIRSNSVVIPWSVDVKAQSMCMWGSRQFPRSNKLTTRGSRVRVRVYVYVYVATVLFCWFSLLVCLSLRFSLFATVCAFYFTLSCVCLFAEVDDVVPIHQWLTIRVFFVTIFFCLGNFPFPRRFPPLQYDRTCPNNSFALRWIFNAFTVQHAPEMFMKAVKFMELSACRNLSVCDSIVGAPWFPTLNMQLTTCIHMFNLNL